MRRDAHRPGFAQALREFLYGMTAHEFVEHAAELRGTLETLFMLATFGDLIGVPILPPYYALRLLPHALPSIETWKRRVLREKHLGDEPDHHLHGI